MNNNQDNSSEKLDKKEQEFQSTVKKKATRKLKAKLEEKNALWYGLGMSGIVGLLVIIPTLMGLYLGIFLDKKIPTSYSFTLMGLLLGLMFGCLNAWIWITRKTQD